jgi:hypothetical protein
VPRPGERVLQDDADGGLVVDAEDGSGHDA